jgi:phosphoserine aminotransferase
MSSDIFCRPWQFDQHGLIYAGAQKNIGAAGVTLVVIKKSILGNLHRSIPAIMDYRNHIEAGSLLNTPPVFAVYVMLLTLRWIVAEGGLAVMEQRAKERAAYLYQLLDELSIFTPTVVTEDRSLMNAVFTLPNASLETTFLELCKQHGMIGIKGHRSVGGLRVSMYNAMPMQSVQALGDLMIAFNKSHQ